MFPDYNTSLAIEYLEGGIRNLPSPPEDEPVDDLIQL